MGPSQTNYATTLTTVTKVNRNTYLRAAADILRYIGKSRVIYHQSTTIK